jgi:hypothetical protein
MAPHLDMPGSARREGLSYAVRTARPGAGRFARRQAREARARATSDL